MANSRTVIHPHSVIQKHLLSVNLISLVEGGFVALSSGQAVIPPINLNHTLSLRLLVADLTGVAVQDLMITISIFNHSKLLQNEYQNF